MRCLGCRRFGHAGLCPECRALYLNPRPETRRLDTGLEVVSFYAYEEIEPFLLTKHTPHGWFLYRQLAASVLPCVEWGHGLAAIALDDDARGGYSHTALLARALKKRGYRPLTGALRAKNRVSYAGQPLGFRLANPRDFEYRGPKDMEAVLLDDIVTSGLTLQEAHGVLLRSGVEAVGAFVLADVDREA
jgi:competence protein ComFC